VGDEASVGLAKTLEQLDFRLGRLKTGTVHNFCSLSSKVQSLPLRLINRPCIGMTFSISFSGTPPRLVKSTIDFTQLQIMKGDAVPVPFSFLNEKVWIEPERQVNCHLTHTTDKVV
jgi:tRNA uridine 5-carboxymethylaminomethyl modification enzyme